MYLKVPLVGHALRLNFSLAEFSAAISADRALTEAFLQVLRCKARKQSQWYVSEANPQGFLGMGFPSPDHPFPPESLSGLRGWASIFS